MPANITLDDVSGGQVTIHGIIQLSVGDSSIGVDLGPGVGFEIQGEGRRIVFTRDDVSLLPPLQNVMDALVLRAAPRGAKAVHRLRGALNGVLARHPDAVASNAGTTVPRWEGPLATPGVEIPEEPLPGTYSAAAVGAVFWLEDGVRMRAGINAAGILGKATRARIQPAGGTQ